MTIRKAQLSDIEGILSIYKEVALDRARLQHIDYQVTLQKNGFLLGLETKEDYMSLIDKLIYFWWQKKMERLSDIS